MLLSMNKISSSSSSSEFSKTLANQSNDEKILNGFFITFVMYLYLFQQHFTDLILCYKELNWT